MGLPFERDDSYWNGEFGKFSEPIQIADQLDNQHRDSL